MLDDYSFLKNHPYNSDVIFFCENHAQNIVIMLVIQNSYQRCIIFINKQLQFCIKYIIKFFHKFGYTS